jgi:hypothetical protein
MNTLKSDSGRMTMNERLSEAGLFKEFDVAVRLKDQKRIKRILMNVGLKSKDADLWLTRAMDKTYWQIVLPERLREYKLKRKFEHALKKQDGGTVFKLLRQMGASAKTANDMLPPLLMFYFYNYK